MRALPVSRPTFSVGVVGAAALLLIVLLAITSTQATEKSFSLKLAPSAGKWSAARLQHLPAGAVLSVHLTAKGLIRTLLLDAKGYRLFPVILAPVFQGEGEGTYTFTTRLPANGPYYLLVDNREGDSPQEVDIVVSARVGPVDSSADTSKDLDVNARFEKVATRFKQVFTLDSLDIESRRCGTMNAFSDEGRVVICSEIARELYDVLGEKTKAAYALTFVVVHEVAHVMLREWDYPFHSNEEVADELATVLMRMFGGKVGVRSQAEYFANKSPEDRIAEKLQEDDRHPLSAQRARNILRWLEDPDLVRRWQPLLVPHMQTSFLERLSQGDTDWAEKTLIRDELRRRRAKTP
jgi:hypothetical protein